MTRRPSGRSRQLFYARLLLIVGALALAVGALTLRWWTAPGVSLNVYREGPLLRPWTAWLVQERVWRAEGLSRQVRHTYVPLERISLELVSTIFPLENRVRLLGVSLHNLHPRDDIARSPQMTLQL